MTLKSADETAGAGDTGGPEIQEAPAPDGPVLPLAKVLSDEPIGEPAQDRLDYGAYADALGELIDNSDTATPLTLSISGPWGAGKTSLARLIEHRLHEWSRLRGDPPHIICWFNAWMHSDAPKLGPALAAVVGKTVAKERPLWQRLLRPLPSAMLSPEERWHRRALLMAVSAVITLGVLFTPVLKLFNAGGQAPDLSVKRLSAGAAVFVALPIAAALWTRVFSVAQAAASFVDDPKSQAATGSMADVKTQLSKLVRSATRGRRRLVIFVDDLERCQLERAIEISETANLLLAQKDVVTVLVGDLHSLRDFARKHYAGDQGEGSSDKSSDGFGRSYFDKIVQIEFALPPPDRAVPGLILADPHTMKPVSTVQAGGAWRPSVRGKGTVKSPARRAFDFVAGTPRRYLALLGICIAVFFVDSIILGALYPNTSQEQGGWNDILTTIAVITFLIPLVAAPYVLFRWVKNRRRRATSANLDEAIRRTIAAAPGPNIGSVDEAVSESRSDIESSASTRRAPERLIEHRARRVVVEGLVREANVEMLPFMPRLPRSVKRVVNREYLLIAIAVSRNMMGGVPALGPAHLGKWAIILERWPDLATLISRDPTQAHVLEVATTQPTSLPDDVLWTDDLKSLMHSPIQIGPIAERMVAAARHT